MKFTFSIPEELSLGAERLLPLLGIEKGEGPVVTAEPSDRTGIVYRDGRATVYYQSKHLFFRELSVLAKEAEDKESFEWWEDGHFTTLSAMIDSSRCGVSTVKTVKRLLDRLSMMGYNMLLLYTEDTLTLAWWAMRLIPGS